MPAMREMPTGAPINVPSCQRIFFLRLHGFLPQNVQPEGLNGRKKKITLTPQQFPSVPENPQVQLPREQNPKLRKRVDNTGKVSLFPPPHQD